jgi:3-isopropylmalate/(R)-2-methylmalate dehydratase small subunit
VHDLVETGDRLRVDVVNGLVENLTSGKALGGNPPPEFLLEMVQAGGLIPLLKTGSRYFPAAGSET